MKVCYLKDGPVRDFLLDFCEEKDLLVANRKCYSNTHNYFYISEKKVCASEHSQHDIIEFIEFFEQVQGLLKTTLELMNCTISINNGLDIYREHSKYHICASEIGVISRWIRDTPKIAELDFCPTHFKLGCREISSNTLQTAINWYYEQVKNEP